MRVSPSTVNAHGQPVGLEVAGWIPRRRPDRTAMLGRSCHVVPLDPVGHAEELWRVYSSDSDGSSWTYLFVERPSSRAAFGAYLEAQAATEDPLCHTIVDIVTGRALGIASFMRIDVTMGVIEVGNINYSSALKQTVAATEAMYLMMRRAFDELGYRRYEWKCDSLNAPSRAAALRYGFTYEGLFRQAVIYKGRNRDTTWFSITDGEWPVVKAGFEAWLDASNFDTDGRQRRSLVACREAAAERS